MGNTRNTGYLQNAIKVSDAGAISFMSGSTMLATINTSGQMSGSAPVLFASTASFVANAQTASFVALAQSASNAVSAQTASFANALTVAGTLTAQTLVVQTITSSVDFVTGSTRFGSLLANTHVFTGSVTMNPNGLFVSSSGNVGIGTTTPIIDLQIGNKTILQNVVNAQSSYANNVYYNGTNWFLKDAGTGTAVRLNSPDSIGDISFHTLASGSAGANVGSEMDTTSVKMIIKNNGNIGIRTTTVVEGTQAAGSISIFPSSSVSSAPLIQFPGNGRIRPASTGDRLSIDGNSLFLNSTFNGNIIMATGGGRVGVGTSSPGSILQIGTGGEAPSNRTTLEYSNGGYSLTNAPSTPNTYSNGDKIIFWNDTTGKASIGIGDSYNLIFQATGTSNTSMQFFTGNTTGNAGTERMRITSGGLLQLSSANSTGIRFAGGSSNLNYYEEGNWTPQLAWSAGGNYVMVGLNSGRYVRIGNIVHLQFQLQWSSLSGSSGGTLRVNSIPFTAGGTSRSAGSICANNSIVLNSGYTWLGLTIDPSANFIYIIENASSGGYTHNPIVNSSGIVYSLQITYSIN
jgi:hypothetical protein